MKSSSVRRASSTTTPERDVDTVPGQRDSGCDGLSADAGSAEASGAVYTKGITPNSIWLPRRSGQELQRVGHGSFQQQPVDGARDYTLNEKTHAFARFSRFWDTLSGTVMFGAAGGPGFRHQQLWRQLERRQRQRWLRGMDIAINPKLLTDFRLGYYRYNVIDTKHDQGTEFANQLGIPGINIGGSITSGAPGFNITNVPGGSGGTNGTVYRRRPERQPLQLPAD